MFRVDQFAIDPHIEDAAAPFDQAGIGANRFLEPGSQTDRLWFVVSLHAVFDRNVHAFRASLYAAQD